jgi:uncharacterized membrane protein YsdA (DUF1294 family)/cold shock CspA family protein
MRFDGIIKSWNDDRGFGFIEPTQGGQEIFVHIKAFSGLRERPQINQRVSFQVEMNPQGKKRAVMVELVRGSRPASAGAVKANNSAQWGTATLFVIPAFCMVLLAGYALGQPPRWLLWGYLGVSLLTFFVYASDKSAAQQGAWRTSENTLHLLAMAGGWPGALVAQQMLRHKSAKQEFRSVFWGTVVTNVAGFIFLASPYAQQFKGY